MSNRGWLQSAPVVHGALLFKTRHFVLKTCFLGVFSFNLLNSVVEKNSENAFSPQNKYHQKELSNEWSELEF
jgi:hypothetical protein